ncbi:MAG: NAD-dependent epimerase/dehydratase family protein [Longimicrobiales bacterium]|nr:NAD-dependent epimerase/dehydratase family protein [Longimicrobiales bacterium]
MIAVSGAGGFIGGALERIAGVDVPLRGLFSEEGEASRRWRERGREVVLGTLEDPAALAALVARARAVVHLAAYGGKRDPERSRRVNVTGSTALVRAAAAAGVKRFVHVSSISVYAATPAPGGVITEAVPPRRVERLNPYSASKYESEGAVRAAAEEAGGALEVVVVRPTNVYGPGGRAWFLDWVRRLHRLGVVPGGNVAVDLIHVDDLVRGLLRSVQAPGIAGEVLHLGHEPVPIADFCVAIGAGLGVRVRHLPRPLDALVRHGREWAYRGLRGHVLSTPLTRRVRFPHDKAERMLGFRPEISWREGVARTVAWYRNATLSGDGP